MLKQYHRTLRLLFNLTDLIIIILSFYSAYSIRFGVTLPHYNSINSEFYSFFWSYIIAWFYFANYFQLYTPKRLTLFTYEALNVAKTTATCFFVAVFFAFFIREIPLSRIFILLAGIMQTTLLIVLRFFVRMFLRYIRKHGYNFRQVLIVGRNERANLIAQRIQKTPWLGFRILGYIDVPNHNNVNNAINGLKLLGTIDNLEQILREQVIDEVFVTLPLKSFYPETENIISLCEKMGIEVKIPLDLFNSKLSSSTISLHDDIPCMNFYTSPKMSLQVVIKRVIDVALSSILLVIFSPLFLIVSILIKADSDGPVFFRQKRVGYNGRMFTCLKFRTMVCNAEAMRDHLLSLNEMDGPVFKIANDPRVTRIGRFLRTTSIDEMPQLINVLMGDMSLVGPRPPIPGEVQQYELMNRRRLSVRPGLTCLWQINGRNKISFEKWMELDMQYIDKWSLWLDLKILLKTIPAILKGSGAA